MEKSVRFVIKIKNLSTLFISIIAILNFLSPFTPAFAALSKIAHQGRLLDASSQPISAQVTVDFSIYSAVTGGAPIWSETQPISPDALGFYETFLGTVTPLPLTLSEPAYLELTIDGETLAPRMEFGTVPFAMSGVPAGFSIFGDSPVSPQGYSTDGVIALTVPGDFWASKAPMPTARNQPAAAAVDGTIYVIGGYDIAAPFSAFAMVEAYNTATNTWTTKAPMPTARAELETVAVNGIIYAIGGYNGAALTKVEAYDPATNTWTTKTSMPTAHQSFGVAVVNGIVYVIGGLPGPSVVEAYDPVANTWTTKAPLPTPRHALAAAAVNGKIYVAGGGYAPIVATVNEYDPAMNTWTTKAPLPTPRTHLAAAAFNGKVYAIGGDYSPAVVEAYDPAANTWETIVSMPTGQAGHTATVVSGMIYTIGGASGSSSLATNQVFSVERSLYLHRKN